MTNQNSQEIKELEFEIEVERDQLEAAEKYPTDTAQFHSALRKQRINLQTMEEKLDKLKHPKTDKQRTLKQNRALHLLFTMLADQLNDAGFDMRKTLKPGVEIPWDGKSIKNYLWRPIQNAQLGKISTTQLTTKEIDKVFDTINNHLAKKFGISMNFPSVETIINDQRARAGR